ncbi:alpha-hydroxy-acid oxidizing enzyme [Asaia sp. W19]|uniref:alpha-hydroxy acid oxidase n=1 Tax=unclassified Asaia TaxID=2685023 RepID=UPI000F8CC9E7|nr:alpha-hydroxy acid oxidase [Asaia sp. W19]RUT26428.1 alpha-hydroxy-acid oxidizing enzyme [Asaia sp. W19]
MTRALPDDGAFADMARQARRRLPRLFADYLDGGAHGEATLHANRAAFGRRVLLPRGLRDVSQIDLTSHLSGMTLDAPFLLSPVGFAGMFHRDGETGAAQAARNHGVAFGVSSFAIDPMERIATSNASLLAQIYVLRDRAVTRDMLTRARNCGISNLILTIDTPITPLRERDRRNGFRDRTRPSLRQWLGLASRPAWLVDRMLGRGNIIGNMASYTSARGVLAQARDIAGRIDPTLVWHDLDWLRQEWQGALLVKGILHPDDARQAASCGADGLILSNHGGRQLDPAPSPLDMLEEIREATGDAIPLIVDGGIRHGGDVVMALALGARAVSFGRPWAWGLAARGKAGVEDGLARLRRETVDIMALTGHTTIHTLRGAGASVLRAF